MKSPCPNCHQSIHPRYIRQHLDSGCTFGVKRNVIIRHSRLPGVTIPSRVVDHWRNVWGWTDEQVEAAQKRFMESFLARLG